MTFIKLHEQAMIEAAIEFEKLPPTLQAHQTMATMALYFPESTQLKAKLQTLVDGEILLAEGVSRGESSALVLSAHRNLDSGSPIQAQIYARDAYARGSPEAAFLLGTLSVENFHDVAAAYTYFKEAVKRGHFVSAYQLTNLCRNFTAEELAITNRERLQTLADAVCVADRIDVLHALIVIGTGTHPVQFLNEAGIPWGTGTFLLVQWKESQFAITANHVIAASAARADQARLIVDGQTTPVPFSFGAEGSLLDESGEPLDVHAWQIDRDHPVDIMWHAWNLNQFWKSAAKLTTGQTIYILGYPNTEEKVDFENRTMRREPLVIRGKLNNESVAGLRVVECAEFPMDVDGLSGSPAFALIGGMYFFVGMAQCGGTNAQRIHILDANDIICALDRIVVK